MTDLIKSTDPISDDESLQAWLKEKTSNQVYDLLFSTVRGKEDFDCRVLTNGRTADIGSYINVKTNISKS